MTGSETSEARHSMSRRSLFALGAIGLSCAAFRLDAAPGRVVAVPDVHGDYDRFVDVLVMAGLLDDNGKWSGGSSTLIQLGDVLDRGPSSRRVLDLLMDLQKQAKSAGGAVEMLIGNHEVMRLTGDYSGVSAGEYHEFRGVNSERLRDDLFIQIMRERPASDDPRARDDLRLGHRQRWDQAHPLGYAEMVMAFSDKGRYGRWLRQRPVAVVAGETLFVHGGISPKYALFSAQRFRDRFVAEVPKSGIEPVNRDGFLHDELGPFLWRGLAMENDGVLTPHIDSLLEQWRVRRIVVGHIPQRGPMKVRLDGKVILADVGLASSYGGPRACLVIEGGEASMLLERERVRL